jgi:hypothetical protein
MDHKKIRPQRSKMEKRKKKKKIHRETEEGRDCVQEREQFKEGDE